jgi:hypothetical protein
MQRQGAPPDLLAATLRPRRAHEAMLKSRSHDLLVLARVALEAAIPTADVLVDLLNDAKPPPQAKVSAPVHAVAVHA